MTLRHFWLVLFCLLVILCAAPSVWAEGSRDLFPSGATGNRANLEWRTSSYGGGLLLRRTLLKVYANAGETILVGSSAVGVGSGNIVIYPPGRVSGATGQESVPAYNAATDFEASSQSGRGVITSRTQELAGPNSVTGNANPSGYTPAYYLVPQTGVYSVVFTGPDGSSSDTNGNVNGALDIGTLGDSNTTNNFGTGQHTSITAWDVTVRTDGASATDIPGRLFCSYLTMFVGANGRNLYSSIYAVTTDGYQYQIALNGVDPNGFVVYGNQVGFLDSDGASPLYHDVLAATGAVNQDQLTSVQGGCTLASTSTYPLYPIFFERPTDAGVFSAANVQFHPTTPTITNLSFTGSAGGNNSRIGTGGDFSFTTNIDAVYDIVISSPHGSADPTLPTNCRLRGVKPAGSSTVHWNGKDNSGNNFPVNTGYAVSAIIHGGEYHFPLIDSENSPRGGPSITMLPDPLVDPTGNPLGNSFGFYDDRGYTTFGGTNVGTPGTVLPGNSPPATAASSATAGYDTTGLQRTYGNGSNTGFGDKKGLDLWTYYPSSADAATLNVQGAPTLLLVKRITAVNGVNQTGFNDDPGTTDDNSAYWPSPASTYLRGARSVTGIKPGDELEYTIYFVDTNGPAANVTLSDVLPANTAFETTAYNGLTPTDGGTAGADSGIALALSTSSLPTVPTNYLSNVAGDDRGTYDVAGTKVTVALASLPAATGSGTPVGSYGFVRFRVRVQ